MSNHQFYLHHHPKQEALAALLLEKLEQEGQGSPFHQSTVLVRNQGMATWLRQRIAKQTGIAMLVDFPQPNRFLQNLMEQESVQLEELKWPIFRLLPTLLDKPEFKILDDYLKHSSTPTEKALKRYQLASQIAALYDKYLLYRPQWIAAWNAGHPVQTYNAHEPWQRMLWQELSKTEIQHWSQQMLANQSLDFDKELPKALHVFGISNFAPIYVRFLYLLSQQIPVHIYWMNPVSKDQGYWEDAPTKRQWTMAEAFEDSSILTDGNPLLASFGRMGREFIHTLYGGDTGSTEIHNFQAPHTDAQAAKTSLEKLQHSIYQRSPMSEDSTLDDSICVHACHTPLRELETLKDYLLNLAEKSPLDTGDVMVLCPDISTYAPSIEAVFGSHSEENNLRFPYRISDRSAPINDPTIAAIMQLFALDTSRFTNRNAIDLLVIPALAEKLQLTTQDLTTIQEWIKKAGIKWGFNASHIQSITPECKSATWSWRAGLDRLLLGYAMPAERDTLWKGIFPIHDIEGSSTRLLGSLCEFISWCESIQQDLKQERTLDGWVELTREWIDIGFSKSPESQQSLQPLFEVLDTLHSQAPLLEQETISNDVFAEHLSDYLNDSSPAYGFLNGSITFCETKPMRAIPAKVICLLGMNYDSFPRTTSEAQFDLLKDTRRPGDRSTRDDDCYFFLEAILSARQHLYFSYIGTSIKDGKERPPSTALQTLIDSVPGLDQVVVKERLHSFDPAYFRAEARSYNRSLLNAAEILSQQTDKFHPLARFDLPAQDLPSRMSIEELISALTHTSKHFIRHSIKANSKYVEQSMMEDEALDIDSLTSWKIKDQLLRTRQIDEDIKTVWSQQGLVPAGEFGKRVLSRQLGDITNQLDDLPEINEQAVEITINNTTIVGSVPVEDSGSIVHLSASKSAGGKDLLRVWINQLCLSLQTNEPVTGRIINLNKELKETHLAPATDPAKILERLLAIYQLNFSTPQPVFPKTSHKMISTKRKADEDDQAYSDRVFKVAVNEWNASSDHSKGDGLDPAITTFFTEDVLESDLFHSYHDTIWSPIGAAILPTPKK